MEYNSSSAINLSCLTQYDALLQRLEELQDIIDSEQAMKDYRTGTGRPLADSVKKREGKSRVSRRTRK